MLKIPEKQKFQKYNRKCSFKNSKLIRLSNSNSFFIKNPYYFALVATEKGLLTFTQLRTVFSIISKHVKSKRRLKGKQIRLKKLSNNSRSVKLIFSNLFISKSFLKRNILNGFYSSRKFKQRKVELGLNVKFAATKKSLGIRMGRGKGETSFWHTPVKKGSIVLKIRKDVNPYKAFFGLYQIQFRLPFKTKIICKNINQLKFFLYHKRLFNL